MSKFRSFIQIPIVRKCIIVIATLMIIVGSVSVTQAAYRAYSEYHKTKIQTNELSVSVSENGNPLSDSKIMVNMVKDAGDQRFKIGKEYDEVLSVTNTSATNNQYERVTIYKYWVDHNGEKLDYGWIDGNGDKDHYLNPSYINLHFVNQDKWTEDVGDRTVERTVLYYKDMLKPGQSTLPFVDKVSISSDVVNVMEAVPAQNGTTYKFAYNGLGFVIEVVADSVQDHNVEDAMRSSWGVVAP